ncbi:hypothetical protein ES703_21027 [subsurface metagenome]
MERILWMLIYCVHCQGARWIAVRSDFILEDSWVITCPKCGLVMLEGGKKMPKELEKK